MWTRILVMPIIPIRETHHRRENSPSACSTPLTPYYSREPFPDTISFQDKVGVGVQSTTITSSELAADSLK
uniref:Uncharacterized protein n=1 Tax=Gossypium raimondii TaxID=29730 RepID=A0A0D2PPZ6_GOSRA|nr:hypothetical protein B456_008G066500 [Gossypium raimondii]